MKSPSYAHSSSSTVCHSICHQQHVHIMVKGKKTREKNPKPSTISHIMAKLSPPAITSVIFGSLNSVGDAPGADRSRTETHSTAHPQTHRWKTKREGEKGGRDGRMRWLFSWQGCPWPQALPVPYCPLGERAWGLWQDDGYIKKKLQKKRKTEKKRNRGSELKLKKWEEKKNKRRNNILKKASHEGKNPLGRCRMNQLHQRPGPLQGTGWFGKRAHNHHKKRLTNTSTNLQRHPQRHKTTCGET